MVLTWCLKYVTQQKMIFIKLFCISIIFLILVYFTNCDKNDNCPDINKENSCKWAEPGKPSIVVRTTAGRIGNILFGYLILLGRKVSFIGYSVAKSCHS